MPFALFETTTTRRWRWGQEDNMMGINRMSRMMLQDSTSEQTIFSRLSLHQRTDKIAARRDKIQRTYLFASARCQYRRCRARGQYGYHAKKNSGRAGVGECH